MKRAIYILLLLSVVLVGCRTPKDTMVQIEQNEDTKKINDIELNIDNQLNEAISQAVQKALSEKLQVKLQEIEYDTDKPVDPSTGKPPVKKETNIDLTKETEATSQELNEQQKKEATRSKLTDKSKEDTKTKIKKKDETKAALKWWQKGFIALGVVCFISVVVWIIFKVKGK